MILAYSRVVTCTRLVATEIESGSILKVEWRGSTDHSDVGSEREESERLLDFFCPGQLEE